MPYPTFFNLPEEKRQKILECAVREFAQNDYSSASVSKIVARAGIAKGSLYQYFADKSDLYHYLLESVAQKKAEMMSGSLPMQDGMGLFETLRWMFREMTQFQLRYPLLAQLGYRAVYGRSPLPEEVIAKAAQSTRQYFAEMIEAGKLRGEVRAEVNADTAAFIFTAALTELTQYISGKAEFVSLEGMSGENYAAFEAEAAKIYDQIVAILQAGIAP